MTACILKIVAVITMVIDHTGAIFFDGQAIWRIIGRLAMPLYAFMIVEGVRHTSRKEGGLRHYLIVLGVLALVSEPAYDFAFEGSWIDPLEQNQILQFATYVLAYALCRAAERRFKNADSALSIAGSQPVLGPGCMAMKGMIWAVTIAVNSYFQIGYMGTGIVFLLMLHWYAERREKKTAGWRWQAVLFILVIFFTLLYAEQVFYLYDIKTVLWALPYVLLNDLTGKMVVLAVPFLALYNGEYGHPPRWVRIVYRYFYPAHLYLLGFLAVLLIRQPAA